MDFAELKKKVRQELALREPEFIKDTDESLGIGYLELNATSGLVFSISTFRGRKYFDIRTWIQAESGDWTPTKKGVHLAFDKYEEFAKTVALVGSAIQLDA